jgi:hypothetical protein
LNLTDVPALGLLRKAVALVVPTASLAVTLLAALPGIEISDSTFKVLTLSTIGSLSVYVLLELGGGRSNEPSVVRYTVIEDFHLTLGRDFASASGTVHLLRVSVSPAWDTFVTSPRGAVLRTRVAQLARARPPNHCELRLLASIDGDESLDNVMSFLVDTRKGTAWNLHIRAYARHARDRTALDMITMGDSIVHAGYLSPGGGYAGSGMRTDDPRIVEFFASYFDDAWNNAPYTLYRSSGGVDNQAMEDLRRSLG